MSSRYRIIGPWGGVLKDGSLYLQVADIIDVKTNIRYPEGAYRVVDARLDMRPAIRGKGGTHPFLGETAWMHGEQLLRDLATKERMET